MVPALRTLACVFALCAVAPTVRTQVDVIGGGCTVPAGATAGVPETLGEEPELGNTDFSLHFTCPPDSNAMFALIGRCLPGPDFGLFPASPCGKACGLRVDPKSFFMAGAELEGKIRDASFPFALPEVPALRGTRICIQFLCFDLSGKEPRCIEISQGVRISPF